MGVSSSAPEKIEWPSDITTLHEQGVCSKCIGRLLGISKLDIAKYNIPTDNDFKCSCCHGIMGRFPLILEKAREALGRYSFNDTQIDMPTKLSKADDNFCRNLRCETSCSLKNHIKAYLQINLERRKQVATLLVHIHTPTHFSCELLWPNLYITGRYIKRSREVSHARFFNGNAESSVESELINAFSGKFESPELHFESAGREDMDVRMIGTGRPFSITIMHPKPNLSTDPPQTSEIFAQDLAYLVPPEMELPNGVTITNLQLSEKEPDMKPKHKKAYRCVVSTSRPVTDEMLSRLSVENVIVQQRTPTRVAQRREMMIREKELLKMEAQRISSRFLLLTLETSSGTYIKEFVNSDFGRTKPSLANLLDPTGIPMECQLLQLDVVKVGDE